MKFSGLSRLFASRKSKETNVPESRGSGNTPNPFQHRIPPELLIYIFELCLRLKGSNEFIHIPRCRDIRSPALTLSHVCSRWRLLAHSTPTLWGNISIRIVNPLTKPQDRAMLRVLKMHFERSRDSPIGLCLQSTYHSGTVSEMLSSSSSSTHYLARLQHLELEMTHITSIPGLDITKDSEVVFPELRSLSFAGPLEGLEQISFPKLRQVTISRSSFSVVRRGMTSDLHLPWSQLTSLTFACLAWIDVTRILNDCPGLVFLDIHINAIRGSAWLDEVAEYPAPDPNAFQIVTLKHLEHLTLHFDMHHAAYESATRLLDTLTCPSLSALSLFRANSKEVQEEAKDDFDEAGVTGLIVRSQCQYALRTLEIVRIPISETSLLDILRMTPCLTLLSFSECEFKPVLIDGTFFAMMTILAPAKEKLVPDLRDIRIVLRGRYDCSSIPLRGFHEMVHSRLLVLHSVVIDLGRRSAISKANLDALREMQERYNIALKVMTRHTVLLGYGN
ncbi:hypothetical protein Moror_4200 [Moniliophthora roreri MCA 2997]|uniref:Uncharacterized protein n=2 Tax=Moniliophthora roreri TaxID=221103 RepID=V2XCV5_MONRO|nr:hypothetical protein Moror_4200 [Moniliophthora roreri MCA 2997]